MNLVKVLRVVSEDEITRTAVVIEDCGSVDGEFAGLYVVYDPEETKADLMSMISEEAGDMKGIMLSLVEKNPRQIFAMMTKKDVHYTDAFVEQAGGKDAFLAEYAPDKLLPDPEPEVEEESHKAVEAADEFGDEFEAPEIEEEYKPEELSAEESALFNEPVKEAVPSFDKAEFEEAINKLEGTNQEVVGELKSTLEELQDMAATINAVSSTLVNTEQRLANKEKSIAENYGCMSKVLNPDGTFKGFTKQNFVEVEEAVKDLGIEIAMGDLSKDEILTAEEVGRANEYVGEFSPQVFKDFTLAVIRDAKSDAERAYVTGLIGRFLDYVEENV